MRPSTIQKRQAIIDTATRLFLEQGYRDTTLDQVVSITGGSKQTLYKYFGNKEGLFLAVLESHMESFEKIFDFQGEDEADIDSVLCRFGRQYIQGLCQDPILGLYRIVLTEFHQHESEIGQIFWRSGPARIHQNLVAFLTSAPVSERLAITDADMACSQLLALLRLDLQSKATLGHSMPGQEWQQAHIRRTVDTFYRIYSKD